MNMTESMQQQYCLRWINHRSDVFLMFDHLLQTGTFTDVTLACEGKFVKCHKMVLAACSSYFYNVFLENECSHPIVILKDVKFSEIKAILNYMYRGEVNVGQDQLAGLLKAAQTLMLKGLVADEDSAPGSLLQSQNQIHSTPTLSMGPGGRPSSSLSSSSSSYSGKKFQLPSRKPISEPPWSSSFPVPIWSPTTPGENAQNEPVPLLKKKKFLGMGPTSETPILKTLLGHGHTSIQHDGTEPTPGPPHSPPPHQILNYYSLNEPIEQNNDKMNESLQQYVDDFIRGLQPDTKQGNDVDVSPPLSKSNYPGPAVTHGNDSNSTPVNYVVVQKPSQWKRYKQYTRNDIQAAIEAVREGMSALQAARKFKVPSRTLYDKVKKMGITANRLRSARGRSSPMSLSPYQGPNSTTEEGSGSGSGYSPEDQSSLSGSELPGNGDKNETGSGLVSVSGNGSEIDIDKMDSEPEPGLDMEKDQLQVTSPSINDDKTKEDLNYIILD